MQQDFTIPVAGAFSGENDPMLGLAPADVLLGVSQEFFALAVAHAGNSGALCPSLGGANFPALTTGALSVLLDSTGSVYADRRAALTAVLYPGAAPQLTLGVGSAADPFLHVVLPKLGFDLNLGSPAKRVLSATFDAEATFDIGLSPVAVDQPGLAPLLVTSNATNLVVSLANAGTLKADAKHLNAVVTALANALAEIAAGPFSGPVDLPTLSTLGFDEIQLNLAQGTTAPLLVNRSDAWAADCGCCARYNRCCGGPSDPEPVRAESLVRPGRTRHAPRPNIQLKLGPPGAEFSWRIDGSAWRAWSADAQPTVTDPSLLLQGPHTLDVRARTPGDWRSEDPSPAHIAFVVDSVPPELTPARDASQPSVLDLNGFDLITLDAKLVYAWGDGQGSFTPFTAQSTCSASTRHARSRMASPRRWSFSPRTKPAM